MQSSSWERSKERQLRYVRRRPEITHLYRIIFNHREDLSYTWEERFQQRYGVLRDCVLKAFDAYLDCGILAHGAARAHCGNCNHSILIAFSCKQRGVCPSCSTKRALIFAENLHDNILAHVPHRHVVFSLPKRLRVYFRYDRKLHQILFTSAWESLREMYEAPVPDGVPGAVLALHTCGEALNHNPHIHGICTDGVFLPDGSFQQVPKLSTEKLTELLTHKVLSELKAKDLITDTAIAQLLSQSHTGFSAWMGDPIEPGDGERRLFVSRYIDRGPVASSKIEIVDDIITYHHNCEHLPTAEFNALEFLAALSVHIPNKWEQLTRHYGYYSTRLRGERKKLLATTTPIILEPLEKRKASSAWAALIKQIYEVNPLTCEKCGSEMKIVAFIQDSKEINKIIKHLRLPDYRAPPHSNQGVHYQPFEEAP